MFSLSLVISSFILSNTYSDGRFLLRYHIILALIHSLIHSEDLYSALKGNLLRGAPSDKEQCSDACKSCMQSNALCMIQLVGIFSI